MTNQNTGRKLLKFNMAIWSCWVSCKNWCFCISHCLGLKTASITVTASLCIGIWCSVGFSLLESLWSTKKSQYCTDRIESLVNVDVVWAQEDRIFLTIWLVRFDTCTQWLKISVCHSWKWILLTHLFVCRKFSMYY